MTALRIRLLGGFEAKDASGEPLVLAGRKAQALLAFLAMTPGEPQPREKLVALLWGERAEEQARGSLRQALAEIRRALDGIDPAPLVADRDSVFLDAGLIEVDVAAFEHAIAESGPDALARAAGLYRSDLLDGFTAAEPGFEEWLRGERTRLKEKAGDTLSRLLDHQASAGDTKAAIATARRFLALDPLQEPVHRALMRLYAEKGDRATAVRQYETCREVLKHELGLEPDAETERLAADIRSGAMAAGEANEPAAAGEKSTATPLPLPDKPSIAVLPFTNMSGDPEQEYFCDGITEDIITELSRFRSLFVIARNSSFHYKDQSPRMQDVGRELGVQYVVEGSVRKAENRVRITAQLVEAVTGNHIWAERYDRELEDIFAVQDEVTGTIVSTLAGQLDEFGRQRVMDKKTVDLAAYDCLLRGDQCLNEHTLDGILQAQQMFQRAIDLEPGNARAHTGLSRSYLEEHWLDWTSSEVLAENAFELAKKAVSLDERDGRARIQLAVIYFFVKSNLDLAEIQFDKAFDLNPNDAEGYCFKGWCHALSGQAEQAIVCTDQAIRLNPRDIYDCQLAQSVNAYAARHYEEAVIKLGSIADPGFEVTAALAACYAQLGRHAEARQAMADFVATAREEIKDFPDKDQKAWRSFWASFWPFKNPSDLDHLLDGLRKAGLPV